jgi:hypothetical protein
MSEHRIDPDYDSRQDDIALEVAKYMLRYPPMSVHNGGNGTFNKWLQGVASGLIIAGIPALIWLEIYNSGRIAVLEAIVLPHVGKGS